jgi:hypothetical protein
VQLGNYLGEDHTGHNNVNEWASQNSQCNSYSCNAS